MALRFLYLFFLRVTQLVRLAGRDKDKLALEVVVLRHEVAVLRRQVTRPALQPADRALLAGLARLLPRHRRGGIFVQPDRLLRWHRVLVARRWTVLKRHGVDPTPRRSGPTWAQFCRAQAKGLIACDFFSVDTVLLRRLYVLFLIELDTRMVHLAGITANPAGVWVTQQARNFCFGLAERASPAKFSAWTGSLVFGRCHLEAVLAEYLAHYNTHRPHRSLHQRAPRRAGDAVPITSVDASQIQRTDVLGGLIHEYRLVA